MDTKSRTILGQPWIMGKQLLQSQILLVQGVAGVQQSENNIVLKDDIWEDLKNPAGTVKQADKNKNYWYWEIDMTDTENDRDIKVNVEAPKPGPEVFDFKFDPDPTDSKWAAYWKAKMKDVHDSAYNGEGAIVSKEVSFAGTTWITQEGEFVEIPDEKVTRDSSTYGDLGNLLDTIW
jgi:hypothetical protein